MRVFAGPNGSGKTTIFKELLSQEKISLGIYVNADEIEAILTQTNSLNFGEFDLNITEKEIKAFFVKSQFSPLKRKEFDLADKLSILDNNLKVSTTIDSYLAADIAEFVRTNLMQRVKILVMKQ